MFRRDFLLSKVLDKGFRGPFFERSAYVVQWWCKKIIGDYEDPLSECGLPGPAILVKITHSLQISSSKDGIYPDASPQQDAEYREAVQAALREAVDKTILQLGGKKEGFVGVFTGDVK